MKVLIIESDSSFASTLVHALEARGLDVATAEDADKGFALAKAQPPSAIVLAVELGERRTGGFSLCNKLRRDEALKGLPLVLMSAQASEETLTQHSKLKTRADHYLQKPFSPEELLEVLGLPDEVKEEEKPTAAIDLGGIEDLDLTGLVGRDFFGASELLGEDEAAPEEAEGEEWEELVVVPEDEEPIALPDEQGSGQKEAGKEARSAQAADLAALREQEAQWSAERARLEGELTGARNELRGATEQKAALEGQLAEARQALGASEEQKRALEAELAEARQALGAAEEQKRALDAQLAEARQALGAAEEQKAALEGQLAEVRRELEEARQRAAGGEEAGAKLEKVEQELARSQERLLRAYRKLKLDAQVHQQLRGQLVAATELLDSLENKPAD